VNLQASYAACEHLARTHYENFPVASRLLPKHLRPHVAAVYAFARTADDIADEPGLAADQRLRLLAEYHERLDAETSADPDAGDRLSLASGADVLAAGAAGAVRRSAPPWQSAGGTPATAAGSTGHPGALDADAIFPALLDTIDTFDLPASLFTDLLSAFEQDVTVTRYATWSDVIDYCRRSANPVGRIVLRLSGYRSDALDHASDAVCTALQLTNFWQDLAVDGSRGRLYVPEEIWGAHGAEPRDLDRGAWTPAWRAALEQCGHRTRALFAQGRAVCDGVEGRLRYELRATWLGGSRILDRLEQNRFDVFNARPSLGAMDALVIACRTLAWRRAL
jgi:hydroxysqualene synthase